MPTLKFLCLHGAYGSAKNFQIQLNLFAQDVEKHGVVDFKFVNGMKDTVPPPGFEEYFGLPPWYRHIEFPGMNGPNDILSKIRDFPEVESAEDAMRQLFGTEEIFPAASIQNSIDHIFQILEEDPEIVGLLGFSEGATMTATILIEEQRRWKEKGVPRQIKLAAFFSGWPPMRVVDGRCETMLSDDCTDAIEIPTFHAVGCNDPYLNGSLALHNMCDQPSAMLFDHGKGHALPREHQIMREMAASFNIFIEDSLELIS